MNEKTENMENPVVRWKQRFINFSKSMNYLEQALTIQSPDIVQKAVVGPSLGQEAIDNGILSSIIG